MVVSRAGRGVYPRLNPDKTSLIQANPTGPTLAIAADPGDQA